jgi:aspartate/methionine/tyrosine aminotransferase/drug/metabolite transporter (DMT)-like permease
VVTLVIAMVTWGGTWPSGKVLGGLAPLDLTIFARFLVTSVALVVVCLLRRESFRLARSSVPWVVAGAALMSAYNYLYLGGLVWGLANKGGVIVTCLNPILTFAITAVVFRRSVGWREAGGLILGAGAGLVLLEVWRFGPAELLSSGNLFFLAAALGWSILTVVSQVGQRQTGYLTFSLWIYLLSTVLNFAILAVRGMHFTVISPGVFWANILYLGGVATAFATTVYFLASRRLGAHRAGSFVFLVPGFAVLTSWLFLREVPQWPTLVGGGVAIAAVYLLNARARRNGPASNRPPGHDRAEALNAVLDRGVAGSLLSSLGRRLNLPRGIVVQAGEAKRLAARYDASAGIALEARQPLHLASVQSHLADLAPSEVYAYSPTQGIPRLRELWRALLVEKNPTLEGVRMTLPTVVPGLTFGVAAAADLFVDPGDVVVVPAPYWDNYDLIFAVRHGARIACWPLFSGGGMDPDALGRLLDAELRRGGSRGAKVVVLFNFPHNPSGYTPTLQEANHLVHILRQHAERGLRVVAVLDDAYYGLVYESEVLRESLFAHLATAHERLLAVKVDGTTKEDLAWGFRIAFVTFAARGLELDQAEALEEKLAGEIRSLVSSSSTPAQSLLVRALSGPDYRREKAAAYEVLATRYRRIREVLGRLHDPDLAVPLPYNSGYYLCLRLERGGADRVRRVLLESEGIGTIAFGDDLLRIAYSAVDTEGIEPMLTSIYGVLSK